MTLLEELSQYDPIEAQELEDLDIFCNHEDLNQYTHDIIEKYHETGCVPTTIETY